jgi:hypothetical protein
MVPVPYTLDQLHIIGMRYQYGLPAGLTILNITMNVAGDIIEDGK